MFDVQETDPRRPAGAAAICLATCALLVGFTLLRTEPSAAASPDAAPTNADAPPAAERQGAVAAYRLLDPDERLHWLENLLRERTERAARWVASPERQVDLATFHDEALRRVRAGKKLSDAGLERLLAQANEFEHEAIDQLSEAYRQAVAAALPEPRDRALRLEAWRRVEASWREAGGREDDQPLLIDWLVEANRRLDRGQTQRLPARPRFTAPPERLAGSVPANHTPMTSDGDRAGEFARTSDSSRPSQPIQAAGAEPMSRSAGHPPAPPSVPATVSAPATLSPPAAMSAPLTEPAPSRDPAPRVAARPTPSPPLAPPVGAGPRPTVASPPKIAPAAIAPPAIAISAAAPPPTAPTASLFDNGFGAGSGSTSPRGPRNVGAVPNGSRVDSKPAAIDIDSKELADRVVGYRVALAGFNGSLHGDGFWTPGQLNELVDELDEIVLRRGDLLLYLRLLSSDSEAPKLESPAAALTLVSGKISATRHTLLRSAAEQPDPARQAELHRLSDLSRRVAMIAARLQRQ